MLTKLRLFPVYLLYLTTFSLAAISKLTAGGVPDWFHKQFAGTWLDVFPGALGLQFYFIAMLETSVCLGLLVSLMLGEFQPRKARPLLMGSLWLSSLVFVILGFGLRLTQDFNGAANLFFYFAATLIAIRYVESAPDRAI